MVDKEQMGNIIRTALIEYVLGEEPLYEKIANKVSTISIFIQYLQEYKKTNNPELYERILRMRENVKNSCNSIINLVDSM